MLITGCNHTYEPGLGPLRLRRNPPPTGVRVAMVHPADEHLVTLLRILWGSGYRSDWATNCGESQVMLAGADAPVVICERELPDGGWRDVMAQTEALPRPPRIIVTSLFADERLWGEVLDFGGYDVLRKPFDSDEVMRSVALAVRSRPKMKAAGGVLDWPRTA